MIIIKIITCVYSELYVLFSALFLVPDIILQSYEEINKYALSECTHKLTSIRNDELMC